MNNERKTFGLHQKLKLYASKDTNKRVKTQPITREGRLVNHTSGKGLKSRIKRCYNSKTRKPKDMNRH